MVDVIIIGAGPSGISCAIAAQKAGLDYLVLEKGVLVNSIYNFPVNMIFFSTSQKLEIGQVPFISHQDKPTRAEALEYYRRLWLDLNLNIHTNEKVLSVEGNNLDFCVKTEKNEYRTKKVIVATGFYDHYNALNIPGENLPKVKHYYDEAHHYINKNVIVVGSANSACDVALECYQKGAKVTMVIRESELYQKVKYWILPNIENRISEGSIKVFFNSELIEINPAKVVIKTPERIVELDNDYVLAMTGYKPDYQFFEKLGISIGNDEYHTPFYNIDSMECSRSGMYLCGVILAGMHTSKLFIENTRDHGYIIINDILIGLSE